MALALDNGRTQSASAHPKGKPIEYRLIVAIAFLVFLVAAIVEALLPHNLVARFTGRAKGKSIFQRARDSARTCAAYAFMG